MIINSPVNPRILKTQKARFRMISQKKISFFKKINKTKQLMRTLVVFSMNSKNKNSCLIIL